MDDATRRRLEEATPSESVVCAGSKQCGMLTDVVQQLGSKLMEQEAPRGDTSAMVR